MQRVFCDPAMSTPRLQLVNGIDTKCDYAHCQVKCAHEFHLFTSLRNHALSQRGETRLCDIEAGNATGDADYRTTADDACDCRTKREPKPGEDNPDDVQNRRAHTRTWRRDELFAKRAKGKPGNPKACNAKRNADDRTATDQPGQQPRKPQPDSTQHEPQNVSYERHNQTYFL